MLSSTAALFPRAFGSARVQALAEPGLLALVFGGWLAVNPWAVLAFTITARAFARNGLVHQRFMHWMPRGELCQASGPGAQAPPCHGRPARRGVVRFLVRRRARHAAGAVASAGGREAGKTPRAGLTCPSARRANFRAPSRQFMLCSHIVPTMPESVMRESSLYSQTRFSPAALPNP